MFKMFGCFFRITAFMISVALDAGVGADSTVKQDFGGIYWEQAPCNIPDADITLFMTADTLNCSYPGEGLVAAEALFKITGKKILQRISCIECNSAWHNEYLLINIIEDN